jgi:hypothetical protein
MTQIATKRDNKVAFRSLNKIPRRSTAPVFDTNPGGESSDRAVGSVRSSERGYGFFRLISRSETQNSPSSDQWNGHRSLS